MDVTKLIETVQNEYNYAVNRVNECLDADHVQMARSAGKKPVTFRNDRFTDDFYAEQASQSVGIARDNALDAIAKYQDIVGRAITDAPTTEETNYILSIQGRDDMSETEIQAALNRYKGHAAQRAIRAAAKRSGMEHISLDSEPESEMKRLDALRDSVVSEFSRDRILTHDNSARAVVCESFSSTASGESALDALKRVFGC